MKILLKKIKNMENQTKFMQKKIYNKLVVSFDSEFQHHKKFNQKYFQGESIEDYAWITRGKFHSKRGRIQTKQPRLKKYYLKNITGKHKEHM